jgi:excisionase family DNA binding protein
MNQPAQPMEHLNKVPEVAEKLSISEKTVWAWIGARRLAVHRIGRSVRVGDSEIQRILTEGFMPAQGQCQ